MSDISVRYPRSGSNLSASWNEEVLGMPKYPNLKPPKGKINTNPRIKINLDDLKDVIRTIQSNRRRTTIWRKGPSRIGRKYKVKLGRKKKLTGMGVGQVHNRYYLEASYGRSEASAFSKLTWAAVTVKGLNDKATKDDIYTAESVADSDSCYIHLNSTTTWVVKNQSDMASHITMYLVYIKHDYDDSLENLITACFNDVALTNSLEQAVTGAHPFASPRWKRYGKVIKRISTNLSPGEEKALSMKLNKIRKVYFSYKYDANAPTLLKGSYHCLVAAEGTLVHDTVNQSTEIGTSKTYLDFKCVQKMCYRMPPDQNTPTWKDAFNGTSTFTNSAVGVVDESVAIDTIEE